MSNIVIKNLGVNLDISSNTSKTDSIDLSNNKTVSYNNLTGKPLTHFCIVKHIGDASFYHPNSTNSWPGCKWDASSFTLNDGSTFTFSWQWQTNSDTTIGRTFNGSNQYSWMEETEDKLTIFLACHLTASGDQDAHWKKDASTVTYSFTSPFTMKNITIENSSQLGQQTNSSSPYSPQGGFLAPINYMLSDVNATTKSGTYTSDNWGVIVDDYTDEVIITQHYKITIYKSDFIITPL